MAASKLTIGMLSTQTHCTIPTIRYYEQIGLLPRPGRASNGHRYYNDQDLRRLTFIKRCREFGFPIEQVRELAGLFEDGGRACGELRDLAQVHLVQVRAKLEAMRRLEESLASFVNSCEATCLGGTTKNCVIIGEIVADRDSASACSATAVCGSAGNDPGASEPFAATELKRNRG